MSLSEVICAHKITGCLSAIGFSVVVCLRVGFNQFGEEMHILTFALFFLNVI